ncbi:MAG: hypothetical protein IT343_11620 [Candidatus Melainabacteria bacterium]|jgi:hypothetical protein|nr:hypothetical protein [Candidatus Melainabacteria bacterium]
MKTFKQLPILFTASYFHCISAAYAKPIEDVFNEMLALRETEPAGFWAMVACIALLFGLAFGLMLITMGYYVRHWAKKK